MQLIIDALNDDRLNAALNVFWIVEGLVGVVFVACRPARLWIKKKFLE